MNQPSSSALRFSIVAGLTAAAVVLPKAMAYASVTGLPVEVGLYTAFIPMVIYALLGSSRVLSVSSTTTIAILVGTQLGLAVPDADPAKLIVATATLTALVGVMLMLAAVLRLGFVANFISTPVLTGFKAGIGLVSLRPLSREQPDDETRCEIPIWPTGWVASVCCSTHARRSSATKHCRRQMARRCLLRRPDRSGKISRLTRKWRT